MANNRVSRGLLPWQVLKKQKGEQMSDEIKEVICAVLSVLEIIAAKTDNPIDDQIVRVLKIFFGCK